MNASTDLNPLRSSDRLLVLVPHPDDETLACGELIQQALAAGAQVRVVFATDGDNNPWPQRWLENRWTLGADARKRWGERRRAEATAALEILGVTHDSIRFLGWPDQGITAKLLAGSGAETELAMEISGFSPSVIACPALRDTHPDHSALRVMLELVLAGSPHSHCRRLGFAVHGASDRSADVNVIATPEQHARKLRALAEHKTQVSLSGRRLAKLAASPESFETISMSPARERTGMQWIASLPVGHARLGARHRDVLLALATQRGTVRAVWPLPSAGHVAEAACEIDGTTARVRIDTRTRQIAVDIPENVRVLTGFVKVERAWPRFVVFDHAGWNSLRNHESPVEEATAAPHANPVQA
ncbi:MAG: PIG-L family deacetylase [Dokdonella sp.]